MGTVDFVWGDPNTLRLCSGIHELVRLVLSLCVRDIGNYKDRVSDQTPEDMAPCFTLEKPCRHLHGSIFDIVIDRHVSGVIVAKFAPTTYLLQHPRDLSQILPGAHAHSFGYYVRSFWSPMSE